MARSIIRRRIWLSKSRRKRLLLLYAATTLPARPVPQVPNGDFYSLKQKKPRRAPRGKLHRNRRRKRLLLLYLSTIVNKATVPDLTHVLLASALAELTNLGLLAAETFESSLTEPVGQIIRQSPKAGVSVGIGTTVHLVVSSGSSTVPNVLNLGVNAAVADIVAVGLTPSISLQPTASVPPGTVIRQEPAAGSRELVGGTVFITIAVQPSPGAARAALPSASDLVNVSVTLN